MNIPNPNPENPNDELMKFLGELLGIIKNDGDKVLQASKLVEKLIPKNVNPEEVLNNGTSIHIFTLMGLIKNEADKALENGQDRLAFTIFVGLPSLTALAYKAKVNPMTFDVWWQNGLRTLTELHPEITITDEKLKAQKKIHIPDIKLPGDGSQN